MPLPKALRPTLVHSAAQWASAVRTGAALDLPGRVRRVVLDTKHYVFREVNIRSYLAKHPVRKLQIGTGTNRLEGWLNTDLFPHSRHTAYMDASQRFPFEDGTFDYVFSEHQIEHLGYADGARMLAECFRVMRSGGRIRLVTPDLERLIGLYTHGQSPLEQRYMAWITERFAPEAPRPGAVFVLNTLMHFSGHRFLYDRPTLEDALRTAGFVDVTAHTQGASEDPQLEGVDSHARFIQDEEIAGFEALTLEARRP